MFVTAAYAQTVGGAGAGAGAAVSTVLPMVLIFGIMYFLLIRPQQKKLKDMKTMIDAVRRGDQVLTGGGIIGKVTKVGEDGVLEVEIADGVKVKIAKHTLTQVMSKTEPASS